MKVVTGDRNSLDNLDDENLFQIDEGTTNDKQVNNIEINTMKGK